jgi:type IV pilus assembly protein PilM
MARYTVLELTESEAKVLQVVKTKKTPLSIEQALVVDLADLEKDEAGSVQRGTRIREKLKERKIVPGAVGMIIPKQNSIVRTAQLPSSDALELQGMALFEAEKFIPFNVERHIISNGILRKDDVQGSHVLITAVDRPVMESAISVATNAGLEPVLAEVSSVALVRAFSHAGFDHEAHASLVLLNVGRTQTDISIMVDGMLMASRSQNIGYEKLLTDLREALSLQRPVTLADLRGLKMMAPDDFRLEGSGAVAEEDRGGNKIGDAARGWTQRIVRFIRQTFDFAAREQGIPAASRIYLCGEATLLEGFDQALSINLSVDVQCFDPVGAVPRTAESQDIAAVLPGMANAWGTALRLVEEDESVPGTEDARVNLLPPEVVQQQQSAEKKLLLVISGFMLVITLILLFLAYDTRARDARKLSDRYTKYNREMKSYVDSLDEKEKQLEIIRKITTDRASPMYILNELTKFDRMGSVENGGTLTLTEFKYGTAKELTIAGYAVELDDVNRFSDYMEKLTYGGKRVFHSVGLPQPSPEDLPGRKTVWKFQITAVLSNLTGEESEQ